MNLRPFFPFCFIGRQWNSLIVYTLEFRSQVARLFKNQNDLNKDVPQFMDGTTGEVIEE